MLSKKVALQFILLIACGAIFVDSKPARGESESFTSDGEPPRVAEADKTSHFIGFTDVLTSEEKTFLHFETQSKGILFLLKKDSKLTDLSDNCLAELASNGKCAKEMETFDLCLQNRKEGKNEKVAVNTLKVSLTRKSDINKITVTNDGETYEVDEDCTNNQIDLEECVINNNRYYPCAPPSRDLSQYKKLFETRSSQFADKIKAAGFELTESQQSFEFGVVKGYEIINYNDTYEDHSKEFLAALPKNGLPEPYETLKNDFLKTQALFPPNSLSFNKLKDAFKNAACKKEIVNSEEVLKTVTAAQKKFKKLTQEQKDAFAKFNTSFTDFLAIFPKEVQETCVNEDQHQAHITSKVKVLELLSLSC